MKKTAIVIGAGPSGLISAIILRGQGYDVIVHEKSSVVGGRVQSVEMPLTKVKVESGAMFVHDSHHPVAQLFSGGRYYEFESSSSTIPVLGSVINFFSKNVVKPITSKVFNNVQEILAQNSHELVQVSWKSLIDDLYSTRPSLDASKAVLSSFSGKCLKLCVSKVTFSDMLQSSGLIIEQSSVLGARHFAGSGDELFIPKEGCSLVTDYLYKKAGEEGVRFVLNSSLQGLRKDDSVVIDGKTIVADKIVIAISPFGYKSLSPDIIGLAENAQACVGRNGKGVDVTKYAIILECPKDIGRVPFDLGSEKSYVYGLIYGSPGSKNLIYALVYNQKYHDLVYPTDPKNLQQIVVDTIAQKIGANITEWKAFDDHTWAMSEVGFNPIKSSADSRVVHVGAISGTSDAIHSVMTGACLSLDEDPITYMTGLFGVVCNYSGS